MRRDESLHARDRVSGRVEWGRARQLRGLKTEGAGVPEAAPTSAVDLLVVDRLCKSFGGVRAVNNVSFSLGAGETVAVVGPNGAGKSTTLRMVSGFIDPDSGSVTVDGRSMANERISAQAQLGYLAEGAPLFLDLSARSFLSYITRMHGVAAADRADAIDRVAQSARIDDILDRPLEALSKGYRRRVALAGAMIHDPPVLILDEPTDGLDPNQKQAMRAWLAELRRDKAILISTHQLDEVQAMCSRAIVIAGGVIVADGKVADVLGADPARAFSELTAASEPAKTVGHPA